MIQAREWCQKLSTGWCQNLGIQYAKKEVIRRWSEPKNGAKYYPPNGAKNQAFNIMKGKVGPRITCDHPLMSQRMLIDLFVSHCRTVRRKGWNMALKEISEDLCSNKYEIKSGLYHQIHTQEGEQNCEQCNKSSSSNNPLKTHTEEKLHTCVQCSKSFSQAKNLKDWRCICQYKMEKMQLQLQQYL